MCGIFCAHNLSTDVQAYRKRALQMSRALRHRGPDWSGCVIAKNSILCHERLAVVGVDTGAQPLTSEDGKIVLSVNGEIYNHRALRKTLKGSPTFKTHSDCEVIIHLFREHDKALCPMLDGMFSFILLDTSVEPPRLVVARDPIGITTLYQGFSSRFPGTVFFASELKALNEECDRIISFPPGHVYDSLKGQFERYYQPTWWNGDMPQAVSTGLIPTKPADLALIRTTLEKAVRKRLMSEVPYGVLLSGGLDSSLIASIAARETERVEKAQRAAQGQATPRANGGSSPTKRANGDASVGAAQAYSRGADGLVGVAEEDDEAGTLASWPRLHSFSIGLENSPDLVAAREVAKFLRTVHHEFTFTVQEGIDAIADVVYHLETYDVTTIRASTPMFMLSRKIKAMGVKMVLSGEGSDEIFGGYLYFHAAPNPESFHQECVTRVKNLHTSDCLRANKSTMAWGLEARVPFLDKEFLEVSMNIRPEDKMFGDKTRKDSDEKPYMEKYILRKAFDLCPDGPGGRPYLPDSVLYRQKEQFSDGVGYSWIDGLKAHAEDIVSDLDFSKAAEKWPTDTPTTKEAYFFRQTFDSWFSPACAESVVRWTPKTEWGAGADPSGRAQTVHLAAYS